MASLALAQVKAPPPVVSVEIHFFGEWSTVAPAPEVRRKLSDLVAVRKGQTLSPREVRRSIERLYATGNLSDVVVRSEELPGGVQVIFELTPKERVAKVAVEGNRVLSDEEVSAAAKLEAGKEIFPERLTQAVESAIAQYRRRGYDRVKITPEVNELPEGLEVVLTVEEGEPTRLSGISVAGSPGLPLPRILEALSLQLGEVLDGAALDARLEQLRALYRAERYYRAVVSSPVVRRGPDGAFLSLPLSAGPRYDFHFHGGRSMPDSLLLAALAYDGTEPLEPSLTARLARRLEHLYRYRGFHDARVRAREVASPGRRRAILVFDIVEGRPLSVDRIDFEGNRSVPTAELRQILLDALASTEPQVTPSILLTDDPLEMEGRTRSGPVTAPRPDLSTVLIEDAYRRAAEAMTTYHRERGFLSAQVSVQAIDIDVEAGRAQATFKVDEGVQTKIQDVRRAGLPTALGIKPTNRLAVGSPLSYAAVDEERAALARALARKGHLFARVEANVALTADARGARVSFDVDPGPRVLAGQVIIRGLSRTDEAMVRGNLRVKPGDVLDPEMLFESQRTLATMEIFRQSTLQLMRQEVVETTKDVLVEVREQPRMTTEPTLGYSLIEGVRAGVQTTLPNLGGRGINLVSRAKVNLYVASPYFKYAGERPGPLDILGFQVNVGVVEPRLANLLPSLPFEWLRRIPMRLDFVAENVTRPAYRFTRGAAIFGVDVPLSPWLAVSPQAELELDNIVRFNTRQRVDDPLDQFRLRFPEGQFLLFNLRMPVTLDWRDDPLDPHSGVLFSVNPELIFDLGGRNVNLWKLSGGITGFIPLYRELVLALSLRSGWIGALEQGAGSIGPKRFFLGGATSLRGFREDGLIPEDRRTSIQEDAFSCRRLVLQAGCTDSSERLSEGGDAFVLGRAELRLPLAGPWGTSVFGEVGNLWLDRTTFDPRVLRSVAGAGLRYATPVGQAGFDVGFNLFPDRVIGEPAFNINFSIGGAF